MLIFGNLIKIANTRLRSETEAQPSSLPYTVDFQVLQK